MLYATMDNLYTKEQISQLIIEETNKLLLELNTKGAKNLVKFLKTLRAGKKISGGELATLTSKLDDVKLADTIGGKVRTYDAAEMTKLKGFLDDAAKRLEDLDMTGQNALMVKRIEQARQKIATRSLEVSRTIRKAEKAAKRKPPAPVAKTSTKKADDVAPVAPKTVRPRNFSTTQKAAAAVGAAGAAALLAKGDSVVDPADADEKKKKDAEKKDAEKKDAEKKKDSPKEKRRRRKNLKVGKYTRTRIAHETIKNPEGPSGSVKQFQQILKDAGYDLGSYGVDGDYGTITTDAVLKYQEDNGLKVDGIVGPNTWGKMSEKAKEKPEKQDDTGGKRIEAGDVVGQSAEEALRTAIEGQSMVRHPSVRQALKEEKFQEILAAYIRAKRGTNLKMQERALKVMFPARKTAGAEKFKNSDADKVEKKNIEFQARTSMEPLGFMRVVDRAPDGRGYVSVYGATKDGKVKAAVAAARVLDRMVNEPQFFVQRAINIDLDHLLVNEKVPEVHARDAIRTKIDPALGSGAEKVAESKKYDLNFDKWSKLWQ